MLRANISLTVCNIDMGISAGVRELDMVLIDFFALGQRCAGLSAVIVFEVFGAFLDTSQSLKSQSLTLKREFHICGSKEMTYARKQATFFPSFFKLCD